MKALLALLLALALFAGSAAADTALDSPKGQELHRRFQEGLQLAQEGKAEEALAVFNGILKEEPNAPGSLYFSGQIELRLGHPDRAIEPLTKLHELAPQDHKPLLYLIEANQELRKTVRVEEYRKALFALRQEALDSKKTVPGLTDAKNFLRERIYQDGGAQIELSEFYDYAADPFLAWEALQLDGQGNPLRHLILTYNPEETAALRKKDTALAAAQVFLFGEFVIKGQDIKQFNLYRHESQLPTYETFRGWVLDAIKQPPKPLQVEATD